MDLNNIEIIKKSSCEMELKITIPQEKMREFWDTAVKNLSKEIQIPGFRPGNAPPEMVKSKLNPEKLFNETAQLAVQSTYPKIIIAQKIEAIGMPHITILKISPDDEFVYKAEISVLPEIELPDYKKIAEKTLKTKKEVEVEAKEIDDSINWLLKSRAKYISVNRPAKFDDIVEIDFKTSSDGKEIDGSTSLTINPEYGRRIEKGSADGQKFILGKGRFIEGFEKNIEGMVKDEEKNFSVTAPSDYYNLELRGKKLDFWIKLNSVEEEKLPELNDEFIKSLGNFENTEALKKNISDGLKLEKEEGEKRKRRLEFLEEISKDINTAIPPPLADSKIEQMLHGIKHNVEDMGMNFDEYLKSINKNLNNIKNDLEPEAKKQIIHELILRKISRMENIEVDREEIENYANKILTQERFAEKQQPEINPQALYEYAKEIITKEKIFEKLEK